MTECAEPFGGRHMRFTKPQRVGSILRQLYIQSGTTERRDSRCTASRCPRSDLRFINSHVVASCNQAPRRHPFSRQVSVSYCHDIPPFTIGFLAQCLPLVSGSPDTINWQDNLDAQFLRFWTRGCFLHATELLRHSVIDHAPRCWHEGFQGWSDYGPRDGSVVGVMADTSAFPTPQVSTTSRESYISKRSTWCTGFPRCFQRVETRDPSRSHRFTWSEACCWHSVRRHAKRECDWRLRIAGLAARAVLRRLGMTLVSGHNV